MQPIPPCSVLSVSDFTFSNDEKHWLEIYKRVKSVQAVGAYILDPFRRVKTLVELPCHIQVIFDTSGSDKSFRVIHGFAEADIMEALGGGCEAYSEVDILRDKGGQRVTVMVSSYQGKLPKDPGLIIAERPYIGKVLVFRQMDVLSPVRRHHLTHALSAIAEDVADVQWLTHSEAKQARSAHAAKAKSLSEAAIMNMEADILVKKEGPAGVTLITSYSRDATCWGCGKANGANKVCSGCQQARYCNAECSAAHWPKHRLDCKSVS